MKHKTFRDFKDSLKPRQKPVRASYKVFILPNKKVVIRFITRNGYEIVK